MQTTLIFRAAIHEVEGLTPNSQDVIPLRVHLVRDDDQQLTLMIHVDAGDAGETFAGFLKNALQSTNMSWPWVMRSPSASPFESDLVLPWNDKSLYITISSQPVAVADLPDGWTDFKDRLPREWSIVYLTLRNEPATTLTPVAQTGHDPRQLYPLYYFDDPKRKLFDPSFLRRLGPDVIILPPVIEPTTDLMHQLRASFGALTPPGEGSPPAVKLARMLADPYVTWYMQQSGATCAVPSPRSIAFRRPSGIPLFERLWNAAAANDEMLRELRNFWLRRFWNDDMLPDVRFDSVNDEVLDFTEPGNSKEIRFSYHGQEGWTLDGVLTALTETSDAAVAAGAALLRSICNAWSQVNQERCRDHFFRGDAYHQVNSNYELVRDLFLFRLAEALFHDVLAAIVRSRKRHGDAAQDFVPNVCEFLILAATRSAVERTAYYDKLKIFDPVGTEQSQWNRILKWLVIGKTDQFTLNVSKLDGRDLLV